MGASRTQPQGRVSITRDVIGRGVIAAYVASTYPVDPVSGLPYVSAATLSNLYNPAGRVALRNSTSNLHLDSFRTTPVGTGDFSLIGVGISRSNNTTQTIISTGPNGSITGAISFGWTGPGYRVNIFNGPLISVASGHVVNAVDCVIAVRRSGVIYIYVNGVFLGSGACTTNIGAGNGMGIGGGNQSEINMAAMANRAWTDTEIAALSFNPWLLFDAGSANSAYQSAIASPGVSSSTTNVSPGAGALTLTGYAPTVAQSASQSVAPSAGALTLTGFAPTVTQSSTTSVSPQPGALTLTGYAPTVTRTSNVSAAPSAGSLTLTGYAPTVTRTTSQAVQPGAGGLTLTGYAPLITQGPDNAPRVYAATIMRITTTNRRADLGATLNKAAPIRSTGPNLATIMRAGAVNRAADLGPVTINRTVSFP